MATNCASHSSKSSKMPWMSSRTNAKTGTLYNDKYKDKDYIKKEKENLQVKERSNYSQAGNR